MQLPETFVKRLNDELPEDSAELIATIQSGNAPTSIRYNSSKVKGELFDDATIVPWEPLGRYLINRPSFTLDPRFHGGAYYVQEASSMMIGFALHSINKPFDRILDLCAAPGGKSTHLLNFLSTDGVLVANEIIPQRAKILAENLIKWGDERVIVTNNKASDFLKIGQQFDLVLCDAPCSGEGLFRRDPDAIQEWSVNSTEKCAIRQNQILADAQKLVKPEGHLLYSTCTYGRIENEEVVKSLINEGWVPIRFNPNPQWGWKQLDDKLPFYRAFPNRVQGEGFALILLQKPSKVEDISNSKIKESYKRLDEILPFYSSSICNKGIVFKSKNLISIGSEKAFSLLQSLSKLNLLVAGVSLGSWQGSIFTPHPNAAMWRSLEAEVTVHEIQLDEARWYLARLPYRMRSLENSWQLVAYNGITLGWILKRGDEIHNYWPNAWRIRMSLNDLKVFDEGLKPDE